MESGEGLRRFRVRGVQQDDRRPTAVPARDASDIANVHADPEHEHPEHLDGRDPALEGFVFGIPGALVFRPNPKGIPNQATSAFDFLGISQGREGEYRNT